MIHCQPLHHITIHTWLTDVTDDTVDPGHDFPRWTPPLIMGRREHLASQPPPQSWLSLDFYFTADTTRIYDYAGILGGVEEWKGKKGRGRGWKDVSIS